MCIFFWFLIIAIATLALNMAVILQMKRKKKVRILPVCIIVTAGYLAAALLYILTSMHGTQILEQHKAARFEIEAQSYETTSDGTLISYSFYSKEGIRFHFDEHSLLTGNVPEHPSVVEVYFCKTRDGFPSCYLSEGTAVCYLLRE